MTVERFPVEPGHIMLFARAIADPNPVYHDAGHAATTEVGGIPAPPTFVQASAQFDPDYGLRPKLGEPWFGSGRNPTGRPAVATGDGGGSDGDGGPGRAGRPTGGGSGLHAEQHYEYHRPLLAGEVLTATAVPGRTWEKEGKRAGRLHFMESITEYRDASGELVVTARSVGVRTERPVDR